MVVDSPQIPVIIFIRFFWILNKKNVRLVTLLGSC
nr:MAG TPA: hypothetical protein [Caudoviricetes sp.]